jgi:hypothetical protein
MREPEELATAPDYRWRRWWNQFWIHCCVGVFLIVALLSQDFLFIPAIVTGIFYWFVSRKVAELDANARGFASPDFDDIIKTSLERKRLAEQDDATLSASGLPITARDDQRGESPASIATPSSTFGRRNVPPKKPVDLPRHRG